MEAREPLPSKSEQKAIIKQLWGTPMETGQVWYLLAMRWWAQWQDWVNFRDDPIGASDFKPGPLDNTVLLKDRSMAKEKKRLKLRDHLLADSDYVLVSEALWQKLVSWYSGGPALPVPIIEEGILRRKRAEVYKLRLKVIHSAKPLERKTFSFSKNDTVQTLRERVCKKLGIDDSKIRVYNYAFSMRHEELTDLNKTLNDCNLSMDQEIMFLEEGVDPFKEKAKGVPNLFNLGSGLGKRRMEFDMTPSEFGLHKSEDPPSKPSRPGLCGLYNLGNTCFMNSALQCLSNTPALIEYFLAGRYRGEINRVNPLGMKGKLAEAFGDLVTHLWSGESSFFMPRAFKRMISDFAPQFSGYAQHDSQELLAFLLDGLHEDLNRVHDKPYIESKDDAGRPDFEVATESWENHKKRNNSIIVDFFQGQFKSTLVCPDCDKISITFDPFMYLSVPLPGLLTKTIKVTLFPRGGHWPITYGVEVSKNATIRDLKEKLSELSGVGSSSLLVTEVFEARLHKVFEDKEKVEFVNAAVDQIFAYEMADPMDTYPDKLMVPVFFSISRVKTVSKGFMTKKRRSLQQIPAGYPVLLALSRSGITHRKLRNKLWTHLRPYLRKDALTEGNDDSDSQNEEDLPEKYIQLFSIKLADFHGRKIVADVLDTDEEAPITISTSNSIVVVWDAKATEVLEPKEPEPHIHESLKEKEDQNTLTLMQCLVQFLTKEKLSAEDPWYCPRCKEFVRATKKFDLWRLPEYLVIHLKRFSYSRIWRNKLGSYVDFPLEGLDLSEYTLCEQEGGTIYDLYAVSNHYGDLGGGHYTAFAKNERDGQWYEFDDHRVSPVAPSAVKTKAAYVLFYKRRPTLSTTQN